MKRWSIENPGNQAIACERALTLSRMLQSSAYWPLSERRVLEIGCGSGKVLRELLALGVRPSNLHGLDLLPDRINHARARFPETNLYVGDARSLPFDAESIDLVFAFTVFSSILDRSVTSAVAADIHRAVKPGGAVVIYDMRRRNPLNRNVRSVGRSELQQLFPCYSCQSRTLTVLPPLARRLGPLTRPLYSVLAHIPLLRTHLLSILEKPRVKVIA